MPTSEGDTELMKTNITLVTGCSTGIGRALAEFHRRGHVVYATARRVSTLSALEARGIRTATLEVTEAAIERIPLRAPTGAIVPLAEVASIEIGEGHTFVRREGLRRYAIVQMDVQGRDVDGFVRDANAAIARTVKLPTGYWTEWSGAFENQQRALTGLALIVPLTIFFIFVLLYTAFNSLRYATLIIANVPFAIIGGLLALALTGQYVSVPSGIGFIAVFGVAMLNGVVLVSFLNEQRERGLTVREAVVQGTLLRLRPVLMTASVAILGLMPMLLSSGVGAETQRPLATVVVGGLLSNAADAGALAGALRVDGNRRRAQETAGVRDVLPTTACSVHDCRWALAPVGNDPMRRRHA